MKFELRDCVTVEVPNILGGNARDIEAFYNRIQEAFPAHQYVFDMSKATFIRPYGMLALFLAGRFLFLEKNLEKKVTLKSMNLKVHQYLERMDFFNVGYNWFQSTEILQERWSRNPETANLLELTLISGYEDIEAVVFRAETVFDRWLQSPYLKNLLNVLSELCANVYEHSKDKYGCALIQKTEAQGQAIIRLAVGDIGRGVRGSLSTIHQNYNLVDALDYLLEAMNGRTARLTGRGGLGLRQVERIVNANGGYLWLRSEDAAILSRGQGTIQGQRNLAYFPGTQVAVELRSPLTLAS